MKKKKRPETDKKISGADQGLQSMNDTSPIIKLALEKKLITETQYQQCLDMLQKGKEIGFETTIEEILLKQGALFEEQIEELKHISKIGTGDGTAFGPYKLNNLLGEGGMAKVYAAKHEFMGRQIAIKVVNREQTPNKTNILRFFQEIRALIKLNHPNIVTIYDAGRINQNFYYTMELLSGTSLKNLVDEKKMLEEKESLAITRSLAQALGYIHANGLVHRDVKPENIIFNTNGVPKLTDFGIAMHNDENHVTLTQEGTTVGSLHYTSPEQVNGTGDIDHRADIYSLGATLYYMLTGSTVYCNCSPQELMVKHLKGVVNSPRELNRAVSRGTVKLIKKMMVVNREKRFQSMEEVIAYIDSGSVMKRKWLIAALVAGTITIFLAGFFISNLWFFI